MESMPLYLVTGFLGAGKTTFIHHMLSDTGGAKTGLIVNEFAPVGVDGTKFMADGLELMEINNGSIFCACLKPDFISALIELAGMPLDRVIVEGSGLSDPASIEGIVEQVNSLAEVQYEYRGSVCIVDAKNFLKLVRVLTPVYNQVVYSNLLLLNKADIADEAELRAATIELMRINPGARIERTTYSRVGLELLESVLSMAGKRGESSNEDWNRPRCYVLKSLFRVKRGGLERFLHQVAPLCHRIKGYLPDMEGMLFVDCVQDSVRLESAAKGAQIGLVIIAPDQRDLRPEIERLWKVYAQTPLEVEET